MSDNKKEQHKKSHQDFLDDLNEQIELITEYCTFLDQGKIHFAKPLATAIRVLVHQTGSSTSLLKHLGELENMDFLSTSKNYETDDEIIFLMTLITGAEKVKIKRNKVVKSEYIFVPNLNSNIHAPDYLTHKDWYENEKILISNEIDDEGLVHLYTPESERLVASRNSIINFFANKDGGAHVDLKSEKSLYRLSKNMSSFDYIDKKPLNTYKPGDRHVPGEPIKYSLQAALRQIAHELLISLDERFNLDINYNPSHQKILGYNLSKCHNLCVAFNQENRQMNFLN